MKRLLRFLFMAVFVTTIFTFVGRTRPAHAECEIGSGNNPPTSLFFVNMIAGHTYKYVGTGIHSRTIVYSNFPSSGIFPWIVDTNASAALFDESVDCGGTVTYFNPGDGRINGQPGDRIAAYCNAGATPPNIDVWVIDNSSVGHELAKLPLSDLTSAPEGQFSKNLGANGVLFAGSDASGNGYAALQGGPFGGTATGDWLKTFSCK